jgi:hypothetical protein
MKAVIILLLIFITAILLTGCGHYGMGRHYYQNNHNQTISGSQYMNGNSMHGQDGYWR